jgi:hypothetical protein
MGMEGFQKGNNEEHGRVRIDKLAKDGHFKTGDLAGFDTYDVGITDKGIVLDTSSGGNYDELKGPANAIIKDSDKEIKRAKQSGLNVSDDIEPSLDELDSMANDAAAKWLRENDPNLRKDLN